MIDFNHLEDSNIEFKRAIVFGSIGIVLGIILFFNRTYTLGGFVLSVFVTGFTSAIIGFSSENLSLKGKMLSVTPALIGILAALYFFAIPGSASLLMTGNPTYGDCSLIGFPYYEIGENMFTGEIKHISDRGDSSPWCNDRLPWYYTSLEGESALEYCNENQLEDEIVTIESCNELEEAQ